MSLIYLGNLFFTLQAENAGLLYLIYNRSDRCYRILVKDSPGFTAQYAVDGISSKPTYYPVDNKETILILLTI